MRRAALLLVLVAPVARADEPPRDFDADAEEKSEFWERGIEPGREAYDERVARGVEQLAQGDDRETRARAAAIFRDAVRDAPERPLAHLWLGRTLARDGDTAGCARSLEKAVAVEPDFAAPAEPTTPGIPPEWIARYELAVCQARAGELEAAIDGLRRLVGVSTPSNQMSLSVVHQRIGEASMALGRLDEAIEAFAQAVRLRPSDSATAQLGLAVAYDRDEDGAHAREAMAAALSIDPRPDRVIPANAVWIPAHDGSYYWGLAYLHAGDAGRALFHFRRYLAVAGESTWAARARVHLEEAQAGAIAGRDLKLSGSATFDPPKTAAAIIRGDGAFQACLAATPDLLLTVNITRVVTAPPKRTKRTKSRDKGAGKPASPYQDLMSPFDRQHQSGVRVLQNPREMHEVKTDALRAAVACVETAASALALPKPDGPEGTYAVAQFTLIRR
ncbi:MAG TPA: tetratricopeptide repeat protein [Kofleriaceae bacterium]|nr:tetratricopeptide repeat protein [Kofleriaceae bacterium]